MTSILSSSDNPLPSISSPVGLDSDNETPVEKKGEIEQVETAYSRFCHSGSSLVSDDSSNKEGTKKPVYGSTTTAGARIGNKNDSDNNRRFFSSSNDNDGSEESSVMKDKAERTARCDGEEITGNEYDDNEVSSNDDIVEGKDVDDNDDERKEDGKEVQNDEIEKEVDMDKEDDEEGGKEEKEDEEEEKEKNVDEPEKEEKEEEQDKVEEPQQEERKGDEVEAQPLEPLPSVTPPDEDSLLLSTEKLYAQADTDTVTVRDIVKSLETEFQTTLSKQFKKLVRNHLINLITGKVQPADKEGSSKKSKKKKSKKHKKDKKKKKAAKKKRKLHYDNGNDENSVGNNTAETENMDEAPQEQSDNDNDDDYNYDDEEDNDNDNNEDENDEDYNDRPNKKKRKHERSRGGKKTQLSDADKPATSRGRKTSAVRIHAEQLRKRRIEELRIRNEELQLNQSKKDQKRAELIASKFETNTDEMRIQRIEDRLNLLQKLDFKRRCFINLVGDDDDNGKDDVTNDSTIPVKEEKDGSNGTSKDGRKEGNDDENNDVENSKGKDKDEVGNANSFGNKPAETRTPVSTASPARTVTVTEEDQTKKSAGDDNDDDGDDTDDDDDDDELEIIGFDTSSRVLGGSSLSNMNTGNDTTATTESSSTFSFLEKMKNKTNKSNETDDDLNRNKKSSLWNSLFPLNNNSKATKSLNSSSNDNSNSSRPAFSSPGRSLNARAKLKNMLLAKQRKMGNLWLARELGYKTEEDHLKECFDAEQKKRETLLKMEEERRMKNERTKLRERLLRSVVGITTTAEEDGDLEEENDNEAMDEAGAVAGDGDENEELQQLKEIEKETQEEEAIATATTKMDEQNVGGTETLESTTATSDRNIEGQPETESEKSGIPEEHGDDDNDNDKSVHDNEAVEDNSSSEQKHLEANVDTTAVAEATSTPKGIDGDEEKKTEEYATNNEESQEKGDDEGDTQDYDNCTETQLPFVTDITTATTTNSSIPQELSNETHSLHDTKKSPNEALDSDEKEPDDLKDLPDDKTTTATKTAASADEKDDKVEGDESESITNAVIEEDSPSKKLTETKKKDRNAAWKAMLQKEREMAKKLRSRKGRDELIEAEADEEEEEGEVAGLEDFGFSVNKSQKKAGGNDDDENNDDRITADDLKHVVDDVSDNEGDDEEGENKRKAMERKEEKLRHKEVLRRMREGYDGRRGGIAGAGGGGGRGMHRFDQLVAADNREDAKLLGLLNDDEVDSDNDDDDEYYEEGDKTTKKKKEDDEEEDEAKLLDKMLKNRFLHRSSMEDQLEENFSEDEDDNSSNNDKNEGDRSDGKEAEEEREQDLLAKRFAKRARMQRLLEIHGDDEEFTHSRLIDEDEEMKSELKKMKNGLIRKRSYQSSNLSMLTAERSGSMVGDSSDSKRQKHNKENKNDKQSSSSSSSSNKKNSSVSGFISQGGSLSLALQASRRRTTSFLGSNKNNWSAAARKSALSIGGGSTFTDVAGSLQKGIAFSHAVFQSNDSNSQMSRSHLSSRSFRSFANSNSNRTLKNKSSFSAGRSSSKSTSLWKAAMSSGFQKR